MKQRGAIVALIIAFALLGSAIAQAQPSTKIVRVGWMSRANATAADANMDAFRLGMRELGYLEGQTFRIEPRYADGKNELMAAQAADLERSGVDVIIAGPFEALMAAKQSTAHVPIIMTPSVDPVTNGVLKNPGRPEGNITGITEMMPELTPERLRVLKQIAPAMTRVAILWQPGSLSDERFARMLGETKTVAASLGVDIQVVEALNVSDFNAAFSTMADAGVQGLIVLVNPTFFVNRQQIVARATKLAIPAIYEWKPFVQSGGLISFGADVPDIYRRTAELVDRIAKGAKPADLPVVGPKLHDMAVNLKAAKALGLVVPEPIVKQAVLVIE